MEVSLILVSLILVSLICVYKADQLHFYVYLGKLIEGGEIEAYIFQKSMDYPRDPKTGKPSAAIHPQLQVSKITCLM